MIFLDELDNLIKTYNEMACFCPTNEYAAALQKSYIRTEQDLKHLKEIYCTSDKNGVEYESLKKKLKKARKEKKRWKRKYFKLYNDAIILKNTVDAFNVLYKPNSSSLERIEAGLGIESIKNDK